MQPGDVIRAGGGRRTDGRRLVNFQLTRGTLRQAALAGRTAAGLYGNDDDYDDDDDDGDGDRHVG